MLDEAGRIEFTEELLDLVEPLLQVYEGQHGQALSAAERLSALAYLLGALRQDVEALWFEVGRAKELRGLDLDEMLREALGDERVRAGVVHQVLQRRGWPV